MDSQTHGSKPARQGTRRVLSAFNVVAMVAAVVLPTLVVASPAGALSIGSVSFNTGFARNGTALVLTVNTSNDVECVRITGDHTAQVN